MRIFKPGRIYSRFIHVRSFCSYSDGILCEGETLVYVTTEMFTLRFYLASVMPSLPSRDEKIDSKFFLRTFSFKSSPLTLDFFKLGQ